MTLIGEFDSKYKRLYLYRVEYTVLDSRDKSEKRYEDEFPGNNIADVKSFITDEIKSRVVSVVRPAFRPDKITQSRGRKSNPFSVKNITVKNIGSIKRD
jgi:hypothetical protein